MDVNTSKRRVRINIVDNRVQLIDRQLHTVGRQYCYNDECKNVKSIVSS